MSSPTISWLEAPGRGSAAWAWLSSLLSEGLRDTAGQGDPVSAEERALIRAARAGGPAGRAAFDQLVRMHQAWLIRVLFFLLGSKGDAEDVAQDTLARAFVSLEGLRDDRRGLRPWLRTIATRLAFNHRRDRATRARYEGQAGAPAAPGPLVSERIAREQVVLEALEQVAYLYREVLVLYYLEDRSVREIADLLTISLSAAKMRLARARAEFKRVHEDLTR